MRRLGIGVITVAMLAGSTLGVVGVDGTPSGPTASLEMHAIEGRHTATLLRDGTVLVVGGARDAAGRPGAAEIYDPATRSFSSVGSLQVPRTAHTATRLPDGRVVILGGSTDEALVAEIEIYDPETRRFTVAGRLRSPRQDHTAVLLDDGRILIIGGLDFSRADPGPVSAIEAYDPATERSTRVGRMRPRWGHIAVALADGRVLVVGRILRGDPRYGNVRTVAELLDPVSGESERLGLRGMDPMRRSGVRLADGRVLMVDGRKPAVLFDPHTGRFEETGRPTTAHSGQSLTLLDDGRVLVVGGDEIGPAVLELFDPATMTFEPVSELHSARSGHQATKLADGTVLLTGGYGYETALRSAEIFDPGMLDVVAYGPVPAVEAAAPTPTPVPVLSPLGSIRGGGLIELPGSGFRIEFPERWSVEVLDPDRDYRSAEAGDTWTALRASSPDGEAKCTVAVGVVPEAAVDLELDVDTDETATEAYWRGRRRLMLPLPQVEPLGEGLEGVTGGLERRARTDPGITHDVLYGLTCLSAGEDMPDAAFKRFKVIPTDRPDASPGPKQREQLAPATPRPLPALGATIAGGRIERTGSGFAITLPETWIVRVAEPDPDIHTAAPGVAWEALRAHQPRRRAACSVYVGIAPLEAAPLGESASVDTDSDATQPYWSGGARSTLVVPPARFRQRSGSSTEHVAGRPRLRAGDPRLNHDVVYAVVCGADGDRDPRRIVWSFEVLGSGSGVVAQSPSPTSVVAPSPAPPEGDLAARFPAQPGRSSGRGRGLQRTRVDRSARP